MRDRLRHGIRKPTRSDIVNQQNRIGGAFRPTTINDFLRAALHLGVATLHRGEIEIRGRGPRTDR